MLKSARYLNVLIVKKVATLQGIARWRRIWCAVDVVVKIALHQCRKWRGLRRNFLNRTVNIVGKLGVNVCSTCDAYSVVDDVKNLDKKDEVSYAIDVSNKFNVLSESNLEAKSSVNNVEYCLAATVVKNFSNKETWKVREVGRQKKFLLLNKSKILVIVKNKLQYC